MAGLALSLVTKHCKNAVSHSACHLSQLLGTLLVFEATSFGYLDESLDPAFCRGDIELWALGNTFSKR